MKNHIDRADNPLPTDILNQYNDMAIVVDDFPVAGGISRVRGRILTLADTALTQSISVELYASYPLDQLRPLDTIIGRVKLERLEKAQNPYVFDYSSFLMDQGVYYKGWLSKKTITLRVDDYKKLDRIKYGWRSHALQILQSGLSEENFGLAASLILGYRNELDSDTEGHFADSGALHVLAVSGLHVGLIITMLTFLLSLMPRTIRNRSLVQGIIMSILLFIYVLMTGSSAPVIRASFIFGLFYLTTMIERDRSSVNMLAAVAFGMLVVNPIQLFHVSFQLSFVAVASIIVFYPFIYRQVYISNWLGSKIWSIIAMSFAAQILIIPLSCFYFHQIPLYFWLSSVLAILLAFCIIPLGFLLLFFSLFTDVLYFIVVPLDAFCVLMRKSIEWVSVLPLSTFKEVHLPLLQLAIIYMTLCTLIIFVYQRKVIWIRFVYIGIIIWLSAQTVEIIQSKNQSFSVKYYNDQVIWVISQYGYILPSKDQMKKSQTDALIQVKMQHNLKNIIELKDENVVKLILDNEGRQLLQYQKTL